VLKSRTGQNILEYVLLIILVMVGVLVMGPYVIRSWNANVKGYDDGVRDSFQEPLLTGSLGTGGGICVCGWEDPPCLGKQADCDAGFFCGINSCGPTQDTRIWVCSLPNCKAPEVTGDDRSVCTAPAQNIQGSSCCETTDNCCSSPVPLPIPANCGAPGCAKDEVLALYYCGFEDPTNPTRSVCQYDLGCEEVCQTLPIINPASIIYNLGTQCIGDFVGITNTTTNMTFVDPGNCSVPVRSDPKCQWQCAPTYERKNNFQCDCGPGLRQFDPDDPLLLSERLIGYGCTTNIQLRITGCPGVAHPGDGSLGYLYCDPAQNWVGIWDYFTLDGKTRLCSGGAGAECYGAGAPIQPGENDFGPVCEINGEPIYWSMGPAGSTGRCVGICDVDIANPSFGQWGFIAEKSYHQDLPVCPPGYGDITAQCSFAYPVCRNSGETVIHPVGGSSNVVQQSFL